MKTRKHYYWETNHAELGKLYSLSKNKPENTSDEKWNMKFKSFGPQWTYCGWDPDRNRFICRHEPPLIPKSKFWNRIGWRKEAYGSIV